MEINKRDTNKIMTNPKYKCVDEGSDNDMDHGKINDDKSCSLSSKEQDIRETIVKSERKRKRKEKRDRDKQ